VESPPAALAALAFFVGAGEILGVPSAADSRRALRCPAVRSLGKSRGGLGSPQLPWLGVMARGRFRCAEPVSCASRRPGFECGWRRTDGRLTGRGCVTAPQGVRRPSAIPLVAVARLPRPCPGLAAPCWRVSACLLRAAWGLHERHNTSFLASGFLCGSFPRDGIRSRRPGFVGARACCAGARPRRQPPTLRFPAGFPDPRSVRALRPDGGCFWDAGIS
jgi:hypothetical protein